MKGIKNLFNYTQSILVPVLLSLLWIPLITRFITQEEFALYSYLNQLFIFFGTLTQIGTSYLIKEKKLSHNSLFYIFVINSVISIAVFLVMIFMNISFIDSLIVTVLILFNSEFQNKIILFNLTNDSKNYAKYQNLYSVFKIIFVIFLLMFIKSYIVIFIGILVDLIIMVKILNKKQNNNSYKAAIKELKIFNKEIYFNIISIGGPLVIFGLLISSLVTIDFYFMKTNNYDINLAKYNGNFTILNSIISIPIAIITLIIVPKYREIDDFKRHFKQLSFVIAGLFVFYILGILFKDIINWMLYKFILPQEYELASSPYILLLTMIFLISIVRQLFLFLQFNNFEIYLKGLTWLFILIVIKILFNLFYTNSMIELLINNIVILGTIVIITLVNYMIEMKKRGI
ncbi:hypothetical protein R0K17_00075 [Planococcus sp. SIMBA_143]